MLGIFDIFSLVGLCAFVIENMQEWMRVLQQTNCNVFLAWESAKKKRHIPLAERASVFVVFQDVPHVCWWVNEGQRL
jgi:hypothetical protein